MIKATDDGRVEVRGNTMDVMAELMSLIETLRKNLPANMILGTVLVGVFPDITPREAAKIAMAIEDRMGVEHGS